MPGSDITFLVMFVTKCKKHHTSFNYVAVVLPNLSASSDGHVDSKHFDVCSMHCVSIVAGCVNSLGFGSAFGEEA